MNTREINRRLFIKTAASRAGVLALGGVALGTSAQRAASASAEQRNNPFAYDVERYAKTDPKLIRYKEVAKFPARIPEPRRIAVGPGGRVYVAGKKGIVVLSADGGLLFEIPLDIPARCVAVASDSTIYAGVRDHVEVFDTQGRRLAVWANLGKKTWLTGLAVGKSDVFAADSGNRVVLRYDRAGKLAARIGEKSKGSNVPGLIVPSPYLDVTLGQDDLLRVNNPGRHCVETYTVAGELELSWGKPTAAIEGFCGCCNPVALALLPDGRCVTCEKGLPRVKVYLADGTFECVVAGPELFPENARAGSARDPSDGTMGGLDAAVDSQERVYVLDLVSADVRVMTKNL